MADRQCLFRRWLLWRDSWSLLNPWQGILSVYSLAKLAQNALTLKASHDLAKDKIFVNAATPGVTAIYDIIAADNGRPVNW